MNRPMELPDENPVKGLLLGLGITFAFVLCWLFAACSSGCANLPDGPAERAAAVSNAVSTATLLLDAARERWVKQHPQDDPATAEAAAADPAPAEAAASAAGPLLDFRFGGFRGGGAAEDPATQIKGFRFSSSGMSYAWAKGDLGSWGLARDSAGAIACAFYRDGDVWIGGKFDCISTSRTTRDWKNIRAGYNGWKPDAFFAAKKHAFCIVSADGRKRTNLITD